MHRRNLAAGLALALTASMFSGCGGSSTTNVTFGTLFTLLSDTPFCDILSYRASVTGLTLRPMAGGNNVTVLNAASSLISVDFNSYPDFSTILSLASVASGTYDQATIVFSAPTVVVYDPTQNPPIRTISLTFPSGLHYAIDPPLTISGPVNGVNQVSAMQMDFDVLHSVPLDSQGQVISGTITPVIRFAGLTASSTDGFGQMDGLSGFVRSVSATGFTSGSTVFTGSILLQLLSSATSGTGGPAVTSSFTSTTQDCAPATLSNQPCTPVSLDQILTNSYAQAQGFVDTHGNLNASFVQLEDQADLTNHMLAFIGSVLSTTKDSNGNVTQFDLFVSEEEPDNTFQVPLDSMLSVSVYPSTIYQPTPPSTNFANLDFGPTAIAAGEEVVVNGTFTKPTIPTPAPPVPPLTTVAASSVYLKLQSHQGNFSALLQVGSDDRTGAFKFVPCASLFEGASIYVFSDSQTNFVNLTGLGGLTSQPTLLVKGLLFYEFEGTAINGVAVPPGTFVLLAKQVHQIS